MYVGEIHNRGIQNQQLKSNNTTVRETPISGRNNDIAPIVRKEDHADILASPIPSDMG